MATSLNDSRRQRIFAALTSSNGQPSTLHSTCRKPERCCILAQFLHEHLLVSHRIGVWNLLLFRPSRLSCQLNLLLILHGRAMVMMRICLLTLKKPCPIAVWSAWPTPFAPTPNLKRLILRFNYGSIMRSAAAEHN